MKKVISILSSGALLLSCSAFSAYADEPVPIQLEDAVYKQLLKKTSCDKNKDGIITEEEFRSANIIDLDLDDVQSLDFLENADSLKYLYLTGGSFSDFSVLKNLSGLEVLELSDMPQVTDISFIKDMNLLECYISGLENITDEQRFAVARFCDEDMQVGCSKIVGMLPVGMFGRSYDIFTIGTSDRSQLDIEYSTNNTTSDSAAVMYAAKPGQAEYTISYKGDIIHKGTISIKEAQPIRLPENTGIKASEIFRGMLSNNGKAYVLCDDRLCSLENGRLNTVKTGVRTLSDGYIYGAGQFPERREITLFTDGHIEVNGTAVSNAKNITFADIGGCFCASDDGCLYVLKEENGEIAAELVYEGFGSFIEDDTNYFVSDKGEVIFISHDSKTESWITYPTGIMNYTSRQYNYFIDENKVLYEYKRYGANAFTAVKIASDVEYVGFRFYSDGSTYSCVYITSDGTVYSTDTNEKIELLSGELANHSFRNAGIFTDGIFGGGGIGFDAREYHISHDNILYIDRNGVVTSVCDVGEYICSEFDGGELQNVYFTKTDNTVWYYSFADNKYHAINESESPDPIKGDVNGDGSFNTADLVTMSNYLLGAETYLAIPENGDLCEDNVLDVFDLVCMRKMLVYGNEN